MSLHKIAGKREIVEAYRLHEQDSGSPEIQVALKTARIQSLTEHLKKCPKDHCSRRGLLMMVGHRNRTLRYLRRVDVGRYQALIDRLGLRK